MRWRPTPWVKTRSVLRVKARLLYNTVRKVGTDAMNVTSHGRMPQPLPMRCQGASLRGSISSGLAIRIGTVFILCLSTAEQALAKDLKVPDDTVALYTGFQQDAPSSAVNAMQEEVDWIVAPIGLQFDWRTTDGKRGYEPVSRLSVIRFKGNCDVQEPSQQRGDDWILGITYVVDGRVIPQVEVFCDAIRAFLGPALQTVPRRDWGRIFGRALGRVVAHELYHVFVETRKHASSGLAKSNYTREELVDEQFSFGRKELMKLRGALVRNPLPRLSGGGSGPGRGSKSMAIQ